jgi:phage terminase small subunit
MADDGLNDRQKLFVKLYVAHRFNGARAAREAGYSPDADKEIASRLLTDVNIQEAIKLEKKRVLEDLDDLRVLWLKEQESLALSDFRDIASFDSKGIVFKSSDDLEDNAARSVESVEVTTTFTKQGDPVVTHKIKLHNKGKALDSLGKYIGMLKDEQQVGVTIVINSDESKLG